MAIARSIAVEPEVLLLDEVLNTLDEKLRKEMQIELRRFQRQLHKTFVFVTHSQEEALTMSDRIGVMNFGVLEQVGTPMDLYTKPRNSFVADFIGMSNLFSGEVVGIERNLLTVQSGDLQFRLQADGSGMDAGSEVAFFVPDERVQIGPPADASPNVFPAEVADVIFKGPYVHYELVLENGNLIRAKRMGERKFLEVGAKVQVGWEPGDVTLIEG